VLISEETVLIALVTLLGLLVMEAPPTTLPVAKEVSQAENPLTWRSFIAAVRSRWIVMHAPPAAVCPGAG
jgi:hypothetical protein